MKKIQYPKSKRRLFRMKPLLTILALTVAIGGSYVWFTHDDFGLPAKPSDSQQNATWNRKISTPRIVLLTELSGPFSKEGEMLRLGAELAWQDLELRGVHGELVIRDVDQNPSNIARLVDQLAHEPDVAALVAHFPMTSMVKIAPILEKQKLPMLVPANSHQQLVQQGSVLQLVCPDSGEGAYAALFAKEWAKSGSVAVVYSPSTYGELLYKSFRHQAQKMKLDVTALASDTDQFSVQDSVERILQANPSVIWLAGSPLWGEKIIIALRKREYPGRIIVPRSYNEMLMEDLFGENLDNVFVLRPLPIGDENEAFAKRFREKYWREPQLLAVLGYDAIKWVGELLQHGPITRTAIHDSFLKHDSPMRAYQGLAGPLYFDSNGLAHRPLQATVYVDGVFKPPQEAKNGNS